MLDYERVGMGYPIKRLSGGNPNPELRRAGIGLQKTRLGACGSPSTSSNGDG